MKKNKYTFLEWVFDNVGFGKFILILYLVFILILLATLSIVFLITRH